MAAIKCAHSKAILDGKLSKMSTGSKRARRSTAKQPATSAKRGNQIAESVENSPWFEYLCGESDLQLGLPRDWVVTLYERLDENQPAGVMKGLLTEQWFLELHQWRDFAVDVKALLQQPFSSEQEHALASLATELLWYIKHIVCDQLVHQIVDVSGSDQQALQQLQREGMVPGHGDPTGNNCMADSLLQLLVSEGYVQEMTPQERQIMCRSVRSHFVGREQLHPRDANGRCNAFAYLQHHRHAEAALLYFMSKCQILKPIPSETGLLLAVHARLPSLGDLLRLVGPEGMSINLPGPRVHLYCFSGREFGGFHYDPLFSTAEVLTIACVPEPWGIVILLLLPSFL